MQPSWLPLMQTSLRQQEIYTGILQQFVTTTLQEQSSPQYYKTLFNKVLDLRRFYCIISKPSFVPYYFTCSVKDQFVAFSMQDTYSLI